MTLPNKKVRDKKHVGLLGISRRWMFVLCYFLPNFDLADSSEKAKQFWSLPDFSRENKKWNVRMSKRAHQHTLRVWKCRIVLSHWESRLSELASLCLLDISAGQNVMCCYCEDCSPRKETMKNQHNDRVSLILSGMLFL